jgi:SAM-dependent methyltransferase
LELYVVTGERFIPEAMSGEVIDAEHQSRYRLAARHVRGLRVLDAGCGVGWGGQILLDAGACSVVGVDIAHEAVADAVRRVPAARFTVGDLAALPVATASIDVVVCFEAIEHVEDPHRALDELARVLAPGGSLLVSSPNPFVYPAGNEFHIHEFPPHELLDAVISRFGEGRLVRQQVLLASLLAEGVEDREPSDMEAVIRTVGPMTADQDRYSMVVTGKAGANLGPATVVLSPSSQLDSLAELAERLVAERAVLDRRLTELAAEVESTGSRLQDAQALAARTAAERDRLAADLVRTEQALARADLARPKVHPPPPYMHERDAMALELEATLGTLSWRITRPLRWFRRRVPPQ